MLQNKSQLGIALEQLKSGNYFTYCSEGFSIDLGYQGIGDQGVKTLLTTLMLSECHAGMSFNFCSNNIGNVGAKLLATALEAPNCSVDVFIDLERNDDITDAGEEALIKALKKNTTCAVEIGLGAHFHEIFNQLNTRNSLIKKYPKHAGFIKSVCHQYGLYEPTVNEIAKPLTLQQISSLFIYNNPEKIKEDPKNLPADMRVFLDQIKNIDETFTSILGDNYIKPKFSY